MKRSCYVLAMGLLVFSAATAAQQATSAYPAKTVRIVVAFVPGGITDIVGRTTARVVEESFGQQVIVDNRGGAGGHVGTAYAARSAPDGYTLLIGSLGTHGISPILYPKLAYDAVKDFEHISMLAIVGNLLVIHPSIPAKNLQEFIALAKTNPGKLNYASVGGSSHLMTEMINSMADIKTTHIPYKGASPATIGLLGGEVDFMLHSFAGLLPHVRTGKLRALGVTTDKRSPVAPDIPTISEAGLRGYNASTWFSLVAPAGTPQAITMRLNQAISSGFKSRQLIDAFAKLNAEIMTTTPDETVAFLRNEIDKWRKVVKASGMKPQQ